MTIEPSNSTLLRCSVGPRSWRSSVIRPAFGELECKRRKVLAHREGRTRSLQITVGRYHPPKSLTLYPIELGGHLVLSRKEALVWLCWLPKLKLRATSAPPLARGLCFDLDLPVQMCSEA